MEPIETIQTTIQEDEKLRTEEQGVGNVAVVQPPEGHKEMGTNEYNPEREVVAKVFKALDGYNSRLKNEVLSGILAEVSAVTESADKLQAMESKVRAICDRLDVKTKAVITILQKLAEVDGLGLDIEYGYKILGDIFTDKTFVDAALKELPGDVDIACMAEAYDLARFINQAERDNHSTVLDDNGEKQRPDTKGPVKRMETIVKQWLLERDFNTKLAVILCAEYMVADHGTEELASGIMQKYEEDILAVAEDPEKQLNGISVKEIFLSGVVAESLLTNQLR